MTEKIHWSDEYLIGVDAVDLQHEYFAGLINRLSEKILSTGDDTYRQRLVDELFKYAVFHFRSEENLMYASGYPGLKEHIAEHWALVEQLNAAVTGGGGDFSPSTLIEFLVGWFREHTTGRDREFGRFIRRGN